MDKLKTQKKLYVTLLLDESMSDALLAVLNLAQVAAQVNPEVRSSLAEFAIGLDKITESLVEPMHEMGWCKDPFCEWKPKEK